MEIETTIRGETFTHKILWECCLRLMETAKRRKRGSKYFYISAMLLAYLTYEAYINFLGDRFAPEIWEEEKNFFRKSPYKGPDGKLEFLMKKIPITEIDKVEKPFQTLRELRNLRNFLSHGKVIKYEKIITHQRGEDPPLFSRYGKLEELITPELAKEAISDARHFIRFLHRQARKQTNDIWFGEDPFDGISGHAMGDSRVKET